MKSHRALGKSLGELHVAVVDGKRAICSMLYSAISGLGVADVRCYDNISSAFAGLVDNPADVVLIRDKLEPIGGYLFCQLLRREDMGPSCEAAVVIMATSMKRRDLERALIAGAHQVQVMPVSPAQWLRRLALLCTDDRPFNNVGGSCEIEGTPELLRRIRMDGLLGNRVGMPSMTGGAEAVDQLQSQVWEI